MMLHKFLQENQNEILALSAEKTKALAGILSDSDLLKLGLPLFYAQLIQALEEKLVGRPPKNMLIDAATHGKEFLHLGYSLLHVVHSYGSMCQAITELASQKNAQISAKEFNILNGCLDVAIASAVSEFQFQSNNANEQREVQHLGFLAHELRNALSSATIAHEMIKNGLVGTGGSTAAVLEANLIRMRNLIDRSLSEVRMRADADVFVEKFGLFLLLDQIIVTANVDAHKKNQKLILEADSKIQVEADRQFILSAVANLVQNAIKYSKTGAQIFIRSRRLDDRIAIEVQDECGGITNDKVSSMFTPYTQQNEDRSGLGLGLTISKRAIELSQGKIEVHNSPGKGCTFVIEIPQHLKIKSSNKNAVQGSDSVQPNFTKKT